MTIHDLDMARFLLGEEIDSVSAQASVLVDKAIGAAGDYDSASLMLFTASGKHATISNSRRATYGYDQRIEVHGSKGAVSAENQRPVSIEIANAAGYTRPPLHDFFMTRYTEAYAREISRLHRLRRKQIRDLTQRHRRPDCAGLGRGGAEIGPGGQGGQGQRNHRPFGGQIRFPGALETQNAKGVTTAPLFAFRLSACISFCFP
jgi:predicted dehydrogenase